jgi:Holliday junction resolvasome RuvABC endonuclease subunit
MTDLSKFRIGEPDGSPMEPLPILDIRRVGVLLSFDQSLSNTGYVVLENAVLTDGGKLGFVATGMLKARDDVKGHEKVLDRAMDLFWEVQDVSREYRPTWVTYETPPVGGRMSRPESSLLGAHSIRLAALIENPFVKLETVSRQKAAKRWTGNGNADKKVVRAALEALLKYHQIDRPEGPWNEHVVDALSLGLLFMEGSDGN